MLTRIVKMQFSPQFVDEFKLIFNHTQPLIEAFDGCQSVELLQDEANQETFFTISFWQSAAHLENYRKSELFTTTWAKVKPNFSNKAEAWSLNAVL